LKKYKNIVMKIIVCVKQVPDTSEIQWNENNTLKRDGMQSIVNPFDLYAAETALRICDSEVFAISMGPPQAQEAVKYIIAMGAKNGCVLSDKAFAGADTVATSRTLAKAIETKYANFDAIFCGQYAIDGDTAQTGPSVAQKLGIAHVTYVKEVLEVANNYLVVKREVEEGEEVLKVKLPALICMLKCDYEPRKPNIEGWIRAQDITIDILNAQDIGISPDEAGIKGSPTYVSKAFRGQTQRTAEILHHDEAAISRLHKEISAVKNG